MAKLWVVGSITAVVFFLAGLSVASGFLKGNEVVARAASYQQQAVLPAGVPSANEIYVDGAVQKVATGGGNCCAGGGGTGVGAAVGTGASCH